MTLINAFTSGKVPTISEYSQATFFLDSLFAQVRFSRLQSCSLEKKGQSCKKLFGIFEILEHPFLSEHFQKVVSVVQSGSRL